MRWIIVLLLAGLTVGAVRASCFCPPISPDAYWRSRGAVFTGRFRGFVTDTLLRDAWGQPVYAMQFEVERYWYGLHQYSTWVSLSYSQACKPRLAPGQRYLVCLGQGGWQRGVGSVSLPNISGCDSVIPLSAATRQLQQADSVFGPGQVPQPVPAHWQPTREPVLPKAPPPLAPTWPLWALGISLLLNMVLLPYRWLRPRR